MYRLSRLFASANLAEPAGKWRKHSAQFPGTKSRRIVRVPNTHSEWKEWSSNPGKTQREKRMFRSCMTMMMKRNWTDTFGEAKCL